MEIFEYISVLTSIIIGLGIAHLLRGVAGLVQHPGRHQTYWIHLVWVAYMFFNMAFWWWWQFNLGKLEVWYFPNYLFVLLYAVLLYLACALLFPSDMKDYSGFEDFFISRRAWFFGLYAASAIGDVYDTMLKGMDHFSRLGTDYLALTAITLVMAITGAATRRHSVHAGIVLLTHALQAWWITQYWSEQV